MLITSKRMSPSFPPPKKTPKNVFCCRPFSQLWVMLVFMLELALILFMYKKQNQKKVIKLRLLSNNMHSQEFKWDSNMKPTEIQS